jgi:hypothetical protein
MLPTTSSLNTTKTQNPNFVHNLYNMLQQETGKGILSWTDDGKRFEVLEMTSFEKLVLPKYFKHSNIKSFVRQLNIHDFKKIRRNKKRNDPGNYYIHKLFRRGDQHLLDLIKRKQPKVDTSPLLKEFSEAQERLESIGKLLPTELLQMMNSKQEITPDLSIMMNCLSVMMKFARGSSETTEEDSFILKESLEFVDRLKCTKTSKFLPPAETECVSSLGKRDLSESTFGEDDSSSVSSRKRSIMGEEDYRSLLSFDHLESQTEEEICSDNYFDFIHQQRPRNNLY